LLETPHVLVAAAIAYKIGNPLLALPLALGSHFILEKVPHWNPHLNTEIRKYGKLTSTTMKIILGDVILAFFCGFLVAYSTLPDLAAFTTIMTACFFGVLPDLAEAPYYIWHKKNHLLEKLIKFQKSLQNDTSVIPGLATQLVTGIAAIVWILN
jgi:hypothetical protein